MTRASETRAATSDTPVKGQEKVARVEQKKLPIQQTSVWKVGGKGLPRVPKPEQLQASKGGDKENHLETSHVNH